jgi:predicted flap endonuclease-1-like 5' DNA nuclease
MFEETLLLNERMGNATGEILIMLIGAFILGYLLRWAQNKFWGCEYCEEIDFEEEIQILSQTTLDNENVVTKEEAHHTEDIHTMILPAGVIMDDLKIVEGIGPKIEELLNKEGIDTWKTLSETNAVYLRQILADAGDGFHMHDPATWPEQAALAHAGRWEQLAGLQDALNT